jgi:hypothetical protein
MTSMTSTQQGENRIRAPTTAYVLDATPTDEVRIPGTSYLPQVNERAGSARYVWRR